MRCVSSVLLLTVLVGMPAFGHVVDPSAGAVCFTDTVDTIRWQYIGNLGETVRIALLRGRTVVHSVAAKALTGSNGSGLFDWTIPSKIQPGSDYRIRVTSNKKPSVTDDSDPFSISHGLITVTQPIAGTVYTGTIQPITWTYAGNPGSTVKIELMKGGTAVRTVAESVPVGNNGSGSYGWQVPETLDPGTGYQVRITSVKKPVVMDTGGPFTISHGALPSSPPSDNSDVSDLYQEGSYY